MAQPDYSYRSANMGGGAWNPSRSTTYFTETYQNGGYDNAYTRSPSVNYNPASSSAYNLPAVTTTAGRAESVFSPAPVQSERVSPTNGYSSSGSTNYATNANNVTYSPTAMATGYASAAGNNGYSSYQTANGAQAWDYQSGGRFSPSDSMDDILPSGSLSDYDYQLDGGAGGGSSGGGAPLNGAGPSVHPASKTKIGPNGKQRPAHRRPSNRDEFDGPHQFLARPPPEYVARQERELPHLPTNLLVQEQDSVLSQVNDRLSQCAFDFVAKYQFPIPLTQDMRPVERPQDREWTEWVYLLKRLATKRRIPARVLYNGQIKQFVTILENSLEMRHAAKHQSRPLKDDRNILQLISAGIQVAKILKDASAMDYLDKLYVSTEKQIQDRSQAGANRFRGATA